MHPHDLHFDSPLSSPSFIWSPFMKKYRIVFRVNESTGSEHYGIEQLSRGFWGFGGLKWRTVYGDDGWLGLAGFPVAEKTIEAAQKKIDYIKNGNKFIIKTTQHEKTKREGRTNS